MSALWTAQDIAEATGGQAHGDFHVRDVTFDSREVIGGELFVALKGEATDGHRYIEQARARGAAGFLVHAHCDAPHVRVADTMAALEALGRAARARTQAKVIGVTGSVGKTSVKEALRLAFMRMAPEATHASVKSYNNHTGVPLSLARMPSATRWAIFEMGMNHAGELTALSAQVRPHVALITWVASAHREFFESEEAIADAKAEIFSGLEPGGIALIPYDSPYRERLRGHAARFTQDIRSFGEGEGADVRAQFVSLGADSSQMVVTYGESRQLVTVGAAGRHWVNNGLAVIAAVLAAGGDVGQAALALAEMPGLAGRGQRHSLAVPGGTALLIDESYNANPASMAAALAVLGATEPQGPGRRIAILGAMRELGDSSDAFHAALAPQIAAAGVTHAILVGPEMAALAAQKSSYAHSHVADAKAALAILEKEISAGDVVLLKGSNSIGLGQIATALTGGKG